ncbi:MAG TPA: hypothetical protein VOA41_10960 [Candidatus Dormibacteraeota bacterium]|nr:hypothetical protein [Candidatus Dormibacteraeota bacterium]
MLFRIGSQLTIALALAGSLPCLDAPVGFAGSRVQQVSVKTASPGSAVRPVGALKAIIGKFITLTPDAGAEVTVIAQDSTRFLRVAPGQKDLKDAAPIQLQDLQVGDRILVRGKLADDSKSVLADSIVVMKRTDVEAKQQREREDWQKRGVGGLVSAIEPSSGTVTISTTSAGATKNIAVHCSKETILRRYAPDSVKFDDAKPGTLEEIKAGDQLRARGTRSADGSEIAAEETVSGAFRNIAGTITSVDAAGGTITVMDLIAKKPVLVKITSESHLQKLPAEMGQRLAMRLKRAPGDVPGGDSGADPKLSPPTRSQQAQRSAEFPTKGGPADPATRNGHGAKSTPATPSEQAQQGRRPPGFPDRQTGNGAGGGPPDLQQILSHVPAATLKDMQKGDAVMIVSTQGSAAGEVTAITILGGVEPILASSPKGSQAMVLSPWSLGQGGGEAAGTP